MFNNKKNSKEEYKLNNSNLSNDSYSISLDSVPNRSKRLPIILFSVMGLLVVTLLIAFFNKTVNNYISMKLLSPSKYLAKVEANELKKTSNSPLLKLASNKKVDPKEGSTKPYSFELKLSDSVKSLAQTYAKNLTKSDPTTSVILEEIITKTESVTIEGSIAGKEKDYSFIVGFKLNDSEIIKANVIISFEDNMIYFQIPTLSNKWLSHKLDESITKNFPDSAKTSEKLSKLSYKDIFSKYMKILIDNLDKVKKSENNTLEINKINQNCTLLESNVTAENAKDISVKLLEELKKDDDIKDLFISLNLAKDEKDYEKNLSTSIEKIKEKGVFDKDSKCSFKVWVDLQGDVLGHEVKFNDTCFGYKTVEDNNKCEFVYYLAPKGDTFSINYEGSYEKNDDKISGDAVLTLKNKTKQTTANEAYLDSPSKIKDFKIDFDYEDLVVNDDGLIDGKIKISSEDLGNFNLDMKLEADGESQVTETSIKALSTFEIGTLKTKTSTQYSANIDKPKDAIEIDPANPTAQATYLKTINIMQVAENLKKAVNSNSFSASLDKLLKSKGLDKINGKQKETDLAKLGIIF